MKLEVDTSIRELASQLDEGEIVEIIWEKLSPKDVMKWILNNFEISDIIQANGVSKTLELFGEEDLLDQCSEEAIKERYFENAPLNKIL